MMKEPTRSWKATLDPNAMAPNPQQRTAHKTVASMGHESLVLTRLKKPANGTALSLASDHQIRPTVKKVPTTQIMIDMNTMNSRPNVAPVLPVACW